MQIQGKVVVITGATSGIGQATAIDFARRGARVIVVGRDRARALETQQAAGGQTEIVLGDVSTQAGVDAVAAAILARAPRIDVLVNNAGGQFKALSTTSEGYEQTYALNVLGAFRLARALEGALRAANGRIVNIATGFLDGFPVDVGDLAAPKAFKSLQQYGRAKQALVMLTAEQAQRLEGITAVSVHPGIIMGTRFNGGQPKIAQWIAGPIMRAIGLACTMEEAVRRFRVAAFDALPNGSYVVKGKPAPLPKQVNDAGVRAAVWVLVTGAARPTLRIAA